MAEQVTILVNGKPTTVPEVRPGLYGELGYQYVDSGSAYPTAPVAPVAPEASESQSSAPPLFSVGAGASGQYSSQGSSVDVSPGSTVSPTSGASTPTTLYELYTQQGKTLPSIKERAILYQQAGFGSASSYVGTKDQNDRLLSYLTKGVIGGWQEPSADESTTSGFNLPSDLGIDTGIVADSGEANKGKDDIDADKQIEEEINYYTNIKTLNDLKEMLGVDTEAPSHPQLEQTFKDLKSQYGIDATETKLNNLNSLIADKEAALRQGLYDEEGRLAPMELISTRQRELSRQAQEELDTLTRHRNSLVDEYNTKLNTINTLMSLKGTDYEYAKDAYDTAFSQKLQLQQLLAGNQSEQQQSAIANLSIVADLLEGSSGIVSDEIKAEIKKLELQAGLPAGVTEYFINQAPGENILAQGSSTDANGNQFVYFLTKDPVTGVIKTSNVYTGGVAASVVSEGLKGTKTTFSDSDKKVLMATGLNNKEIAAVEQLINTDGLDALDEYNLSLAQRSTIEKILQGKDSLYVDPLAAIEKKLDEAKELGYSYEEVKVKLQEMGLDPDKYIRKGKLGFGWVIL